MSIELVQPPGPALEAVRKTVIALAEAHAFLTPNLKSAEPASIQITTAHRSAGLPLTSLGGDRRLGTVIWRGWRFILTDKSQQPLASAEAAQVDTDEYQFSELTEGPYVAATVEAIRQANDLPAADAPFEPVLLVVPALSVAALWLRRVERQADGIGPADLLLPLPPGAAGLDPFEPLASAAFLTALQRLAASVPQDNIRGG